MNAFRRLAPPFLGLAAVAAMACGCLGQPRPSAAPNAVGWPAIPVGLDRNRLATFRIDIKPRGHGSGVAVSREGHIVTAYHVVDNAKKLEITTVEPGGQIRTYPAQVVAVDKKHDLAVIRINRRLPYPAVLADPAEIRVGQAIYNVGYPHDFGEMVGRGSIMRLGWSDTIGGDKVEDAIVVDIKNGAGTSGSAVFEAATGKIIGILTLKVWVPSRSPATVIHAVRSIKYVRAMLDKAGVRYLTDFRKIASGQKGPPCPPGRQR